MLAAWTHGKRTWVYRKLAEKDLLLAPPVRKQFVSGEGFDYLGRRYRLLLVGAGGQMFGSTAAGCTCTCSGHWHPMQRARS